MFFNFINIFVPIKEDVCIPLACPSGVLFQLKSEQLSTRSAVLAGLRSIIRMVFQHGIATLTLPLALATAPPIDVCSQHSSYHVHELWFWTYRRVDGGGRDEQRPCSSVSKASSWRMPALPLPSPRPFSSCFHQFDVG